MIAGSTPDDAFHLEQYHIHLDAVVQSAFAGQSGVRIWHLMVCVCQLKGHIVACGTKGSIFPVPVLHGARLNVCQGSRQWTSAASSTVPGLRPQQCIQCHVHITSKL
jgi:hypothetical protein